MILPDLPLKLSSVVENPFKLEQFIDFAESLVSDKIESDWISEKTPHEPSVNWLYVKCGDADDEEGPVSYMRHIVVGNTEEMLCWTDWGCERVSDPGFFEFEGRKEVIFRTLAPEEA